MKEQIRIYYISDSYRLLFHSLDPAEFYSEYSKYVNTLAVSKKENTYITGSWFMSISEYGVFLKNDKKQEAKIKPKLTILDGGLTTEN